VSADSRLPRLRIELENRIEVGGCNANSRIGHGNYYIVSVTPRVDPDLAAAVHILGCITDDVLQHLGQSRYIAIQEDRCVRQVYEQQVAASCDHRTQGRDRALNEVRHSNPLAPQLEVTQPPTRNIQEVVDHPGHLTRLTLDDLGDALARGDVERVAFEQ
jgi:hypothetical protein